VDPRVSDYCSDLAYAPLSACARIALDHVRPLTILPDSGFNRVDPGYAYALGGSFVSYLVLHYGYHAFGRFYYQLAAQPKDSEADYNRATEAVFHRPVRTLISAWSDWLGKQG
jgi:hypothetical protein